MIYKILKFIYHLIASPISRIGFLKKRYINFILPNILPLISKRVIFHEYPSCNQKTLLTGSGIVFFGQKCSLGYKLGGFHRGGSIEIQPRYKDSVIKIGNNVSTNNNLFLCAANYIEIGDKTLIGQYVTIMDHEAHGMASDKRRQLGEIGQVIVGQNVWLGNNVILLKNSEIGDNTIVAAGAVVSGKFPANVIIGGVPAKIIKNL
jgi:acetyltransferase-like isoleucine patch superfamily enzyme